MKLKYFILLVVALASFIFPTAMAQAASTIANPDTRYFVSVGGDGSFQSIILFIVERILLPLVGIISIFFVMLGGFRYITSAGNDEVAESGKKMLTNALIGLVIVILSYVIVVAVINALKGEVL